MKEQILKLLSDHSYKQRKINDIAKSLGQDEVTEDYVAFVKLMNEMEENGDVIRDRNNNYFLIDQLRFFRGTLDMNKKGFGFVKVDEEREFYINERNINGAYDTDYVLIEKVQSRGEKEEGRVVRVLKRGTNRYVGEVRQGKRDVIVVPDDAKFKEWIFVDHAHAHGAVPGHKVVVEIKVYKPEIKGDIVHIIGHKNDPGVDILSIVHAHDVDIEFPQDVYDQVAEIGDEIDPSDLKNRVDLRDVQIVTIDGDDAKDLDDAISLKKLKNGHYELGVHIADVSFYVQEGTALDKEAVKRGTSIYLVDRVIPMLPHKLSNGICSLNEGVDRYTISCLMEVDEKGKVVDHKIVPSVIHSDHRMTYNNVNKILAGDQEVAKQYEDAVDLFFRMKELAAILRAKRDRRGAIDFDVNEAKVLVDEAGVPVDIIARERGESDHIIEEFMLCANETIAEHFKWMDLPFIYRVHENPKVKKLQQFVNIAKPLGYEIHGSLEKVNPHELARIVEESKDQPEHTIIATLLLRCMQKARYDAQCLGHFGLADDYYTHFTSPIRRYPDLLVHRLIRTYLFESRMDMVSHYQELVPLLAEQASNRERIAIDVEREVEDMKKAEYMSAHIGEVFEGIISSITNFGFFVELPNTIEGLVHISDLTDDYYNYDEKNLMLLGERTGRMYKMSDKVKIRVLDCNKKEKTIDFELASTSVKRKKVKPGQHQKEEKPFKKKNFHKKRHQRSHEGAPHEKKEPAKEYHHFHKERKRKKR